MKVRNIIHKAAVLGSSAVMLGATAMSSLAYDLADYPAQFIVDGATDGKIVVGEKAATPDVLGAIDIAASLQAGSVTSEAVEIPGVSGETTLTGDAFRLETSSDLLEIREVVGDIYDTLTVSELEALGGGQITTDEGSTDYSQYLRLADSSSTDLEKMAVNYVEDEDDVLGDFLVIDDNLPFFEWEIEFSEGLEAAVESNQLEDLEDEVFNIFGTDFTFVDSSIATSTDGITLEFMAGDISDTLREGETKTYTIDGVDYEVTAVFISDPSDGSTAAEAKFAVNGELTDGLADGDTDTLNNGLQIGVRDLLVNSREGVVEFFLGANKIELTDSNYASETLSSGEYAGTVEIGNENIEDGSVAIIGQELSAGTKFEITSIKYRLKADAIVGSTIYIPPGHGVREYLDEPEGLLSPTFDIKYMGLKKVGSTKLAVEAVSDHSYELTVTNLRGKEYADVPFVSNQNSTFVWGDDDDAIWFTEADLAGAFNVTTNTSEPNAVALSMFSGTDGSVAAALSQAIDLIGDSNLTFGSTNVSANSFNIFPIADDHYFVLSEVAVGTADEKTDSAIMRYDDIDTSDRILTFTDMSTGEDRQVTYTTNTANVNVLGSASNFVVLGQTYRVWIKNDTAGADAYALAIDLTGDANITGAEAGFTVKGGGVLDLGTQVAGTALIGAVSGVTMNLTVPSDQFDDGTADENFAWRLNVSSEASEVTMSIPSGYWIPVNGVASGSNEYNKAVITNDDQSDDYDRTVTDYGAVVEYYNPSGSNDAEELSIMFPDTQVGAQVFVVAGVTEASETGAGTVSRDIVNPIAVGLAVLDKDASGMLGNENLIIVGGPCANTVASAFLDNPANCAEGFTPGKAMISAKDYGSNVAILVAGYEAQETLGASYVLADYATYLADAEGSEVEVVASDLSDLSVMAPSMDEE